MKRAINAFAWYLVLMILVLSLPARAMAVSAEFWKHPTGGTDPVFDWSVSHIMEAVGHTVIQVWEWIDQP